MQRVAGKIALVTGGASGIGRATVKALLREGAQVVISDLDVEAGQALADELGAAASFLRHDVGCEGDWTVVMTEVQRRHGRLDILVNNAGILLRGNIEQATLDDWQRLMRVNADSVFLGCRAAVAMMKQQGAGSIINVSSIAGLAGQSDYAAYCGSKGASTALTRAVAAYCRQKKYRIRCNSIHPDGVSTPMSISQYPAGLDPSLLTIDVDPMNRACLPEDVAAAVLFLASDESRAINGMELRVDSGQFVMSACTGMPR